MNENQKKPAPDTNPDPITGQPGAHPVGTGLGAAGGGAALGAAVGAVAGPVGAAVGAVVGAVAGGYGGKAAAEAINPTLETKYWRENYATRPYVEPKATYDEYSPAYQYGWESYARQGAAGRTFDSVEPELSRGWDKARGSSRLEWERAREATRDAWNRVQGTGSRSVPSRT